MPQQSGPLVGQNFTDDVWRAINGPEPAIVGDPIGTAYAIGLPTGTDEAQLGSGQVDSTSVVAGFMHRIPAGDAQGIVIPPSTTPVGRTDIIAVRFDPSYNTAPGPCRLVRIAGVEGSTALPAYDGGPPGVEDMPLWAVTRKKDQSLNQAAVQDLRVRSGPNLLVPSASSDLPANVPLGTRARRPGAGEWVRELNAAGAPSWVSTSSGRLLGVYTLNWQALAPSGALGAGVSVFGGPGMPVGGVQRLGYVDIPDPGVPWRAALQVGGWFGNESNDGTRYDFDFVVAPALYQDIFILPNLYHGGAVGAGVGLTGYKWFSTMPTTRVFTGTQQVQFQGRKIYGNGYGAIAQDNRQGRVAVYAA